MRFGSVCSGIKAASVAWEPLGWHAAWFSEIEPFPSAVLAHHYPDTTNLGDMTGLPIRILQGEVEAPDILCGGTPCQAFSVAGLRQSLNDPRGNLSLTFCKIADANDHIRELRSEPPSIVLWENVSGVLSTRDNAFGCFLAGLAGEDGELKPSGGKWTNAGCVYGPQRAVAWRVLDAQYFGVAQRRRRVFVVASAREGFDPAAVLFEFDSVRRDSAPSREAREDAARGAAGGTGVDFQNSALSGDLAGTLDAEGQRRGNRGHGVLAFDTTQITSAANYSRPLDNSSTTVVQQPVAFHPTQDPISSTDVCHSLGANDNATAAAAFTQNQRDEVRTLQVAGVRRLTPVECERLQGFPDEYTAIPWRKKPADECPDGPRYKALGNSWAVPVVRWIGERIKKATQCNGAASTTSTSHAPSSAK